MKNLKPKILKLKPETDFMAEVAGFCRKQKITAGWLQSIGAMKNITLAHFDPDGKKYTEKRFAGQFEIVSLSGTISICRGEIHFHLHASFSNNQMKVFAGHLKSATVSPTAEIIIWQCDKKLTRAFDLNIGLDILD